MKTLARSLVCALLTLSGQAVAAQAVLPGTSRMVEVVDQNGAPIEGARVELITVALSNFGATRMEVPCIGRDRAEGQSAPDGRCTFRLAVHLDSPANLVYASASKTGFVPLTTPMRKDDPDTHRVVLTRDAVSFSGKVEPMTPDSSVTAVAFLSHSMVAQPVAVSADGSFAFELPRAERAYAIVATRPGFAPAVVALGPDTAERDDVMIRMSVGRSVTGKVVEDGTRRPLREVAVTERFAVSVFPFEQRTLTDANGRFVVRGISPAAENQQVRVEKAGFIAATRGPVSLPDELGEIGLIPSKHLTVAVASPVLDATHTVSILETDGTLVREGLATAAGRAEFDLPEGSYRVRVAGYPLADSETSVELHTNRTLNVILREGGVLAFRATSVLGLPLSGLRVRCLPVLDDVANPGGEFVLGDQRSASTDAAGAIRFDRLQPGSYRISIDDDGVIGDADVDGMLERSFLVADGETVGVQATLASPVEVDLAVAPDVPGLTVTISELTATGTVFTRFRPRRLTVIDGVAPLGRIVPGTYRVTSDVDGEYFADDIEFIVNGEKQTINLPLRRVHPLKGIVVAPDGQPLEGARVSIERLRDDHTTSESLQQVATAADGRFEFTGPRPGKYQVVARAPNLSPVVFALTVNGSNSTNEILLQLVQGIGLQVEFTSADEQPKDFVATLIQEETDLQFPCVREGLSCTFSDLPSGTLTLRVVRLDGGKPLEVPVQTGVAERIVVRLP